uniref:Uncharacterized protein n=1 Tax=viral metagenome TaxID=1070528 RepID=A0A6H1ZH89_9ZZZZ
MEKKRNIIVSEKQRAVIKPDTPAGEDTYIKAWKIQPVINPEGVGGDADDNQDIRKQFLFSGEWVPDQDPLVIGADNYSDLQNLRYNDRGLEGVQGYTKINTTVIPAATQQVRSAIHFTTPHTYKSYVVAYSESATGGDAGLFVNLGVIPAQTDFVVEELWPCTLDENSEVGRFSKFPGGDIAYANGIESMIWGGYEQRVAACIIAASGEASTGLLDQTEIVQNILDDSDNIVTIDAAGNPNFVVGSTRPLQGVKVYVKTPNVSAGVMSVKYWTGSAWVTVDSGDVVDSTILVAGKTLSQTGTVTFPSTVSLSGVKFLEERLLYWYDFEVSGGSAAISHITTIAPPQAIGDIWDGIYRPPLQAIYNLLAVPIDRTMEIITETPAGWYKVKKRTETGGIDWYYYEGYYVDISLLDSDHEIELSFAEKMCCLKIKMLQEMVNRTESGNTLVVKYWNGDAWVAVTGLDDGTEAVAGYPFSKSGFISWSPTTDEVKKSNHGITAYRYLIYATPGLSVAADTIDWGMWIWIDLISGVPSPRDFETAYRFPFMFQNRAMLCGSIGTNQGGRVDYGMMHSSNVWNGEDSSDGPAGPLYFGSSGDLTAACEVYNRFGSNVYTTGIFCKKNETYLLTGFDADTWRIYPVSTAVGCPAPLTMISAEVGFGMGEEAVRNIAIWLAYSGPVVFDAGVILPIKNRISCFFDRADSRCINYDEIDKSVAWVDVDNNEYNLLIPSGVGQTTNNKWLVLDLIRKKWFEKVPTAAEDPYPQFAMSVVDEYGAQYTYGFRDNGYMVRLENGPTWDGEAIEQKVVTSDHVPGDDIWEQTELRRFKLISVRVDEAVDLSLSHYIDGATGTTALASIDADTGLARYVKNTQALNKTGWSHRFGISTETEVETHGVPLLAWGYTFKKIREDQ